MTPTDPGERPFELIADKNRPVIVHVANGYAIAQATGMNADGMNADGMTQGPAISLIWDSYDNKRLATILPLQTREALDHLISNLTSLRDSSF